jgi:hypothetical protein
VRVIQELRRAYPDWEVEDEDEEARVEGLKVKRQRGKGAPKKRRSAAGTFRCVHDWLAWILTYMHRIEETAEEKTGTGEASTRGLRRLLIQSSIVRWRWIMNLPLAVWNGITIHSERIVTRPLGYCEFLHCMAWSMVDMVATIAAAGRSSHISSVDGFTIQTLYTTGKQGIELDIAKNSIHPPHPP